jgi:predicted ATPase
MMQDMSQPSIKNRRPETGIKGIFIRGFKSIKNKIVIHFQPLTIIAGANSSGKSSAFQPLLLLKQTLDSPFDQGPLRISGENTKFSEASQLFWSGGKKNDVASEFEIGFILEGSNPSVVYEKAKIGLHINRVEFDNRGKRETINENFTEDALKKIFTFSESIGKQLFGKSKYKTTVSIQRKRWYLDINYQVVLENESVDAPFFSPSFVFFTRIQREINRIIHLPGLRGNPERFYPETAIGKSFSGVFTPYSASIIANWKDRKDSSLEHLSNDMRAIGLTWKVEPRRIDDTRVELRVGRLPQSAQGGANDLVSIADVGVGVSQTLPLLVALLAAEKGQIVYVEQPEIHLHPRAQVALAPILIRAANRGVITVIETHSSLLLKSIQEQVAIGAIKPDKTVLHWFSRDENGVTNVKSDSFAEDGSYGDWPEDFADTELNIEDRFLRASFGKNHG